jgi:hypothetical protein
VLIPRMATSKSPTCGHLKIPHLGQADVPFGESDLSLQMIG